MSVKTKKIVLTLPPLLFDDMKRIAKVAGMSQQALYRAAINAMITDPSLLLSQERSRTEKVLADAFPQHNNSAIEAYVEREWND